MTMNEEEMGAECRRRLADLQRQFVKDCQPYVDILVGIELRRPPAPIYVDMADLPPHILERLKNVESEPR